MPLDAFHPAIERWFAARLGEPTPVQRRAWPAIRSGAHVLIAAPTGSGKTLAAFLAAIDSLFARGRRSPTRRPSSTSRRSRPRWWNGLQRSGRPVRRRVNERPLLAEGLARSVAIRCEAQGEEREVVLELRAPTSARGQVVDALSGAPIPGAEVQLWTNEGLHWVHANSPP